MLSCPHGQWDSMQASNSILKLNHCPINISATLSTWIKNAHHIRRPINQVEFQVDFVWSSEILQQASELYLSWITIMHSGRFIAQFYPDVPDKRCGTVRKPCGITVRCITPHQTGSMMGLGRNICDERCAERQKTLLLIKLCKISGSLCIQTKDMRRYQMQAHIKSSVCSHINEYLLIVSASQAA